MAEQLSRKTLYDLLLGDRAYDADAIRRALRVRGIRPFLAERNTRHD